METRAPSREERIVMLRKRDGDFCMHPECGKPLDFSINYDDENNSQAVTIDHWMPLAHDGTWDLDNLKLMHRKCNQLKGDIVPHSDGTLPKRRQSTFRRRAEKRSGREEICQKCISGRLLLFGEVCDVCGSGPQPAVFPQAYKVEPKDCAHKGMQWCWACTGIGLYEREPAIVTVLDGEYSLEPASK